MIEYAYKYTCPHLLAHIVHSLDLKFIPLCRHPYTSDEDSVNSVVVQVS